MLGVNSTHYLKICYTNIIPIQRNFSIGTLIFDRWLMVVPSIDRGNRYLTLALVGSLERVKALQQPLHAYLSFSTYDSHVCSYIGTLFSSLGGSVP